MKLLVTGDTGYSGIVMVPLLQSEESDVPDLDSDLFEAPTRTARHTRRDIRDVASRFVFSSACSTYGAGGVGATTEDSDLNPATPYGESRVLVERVHNESFNIGRDDENDQVRDIADDLSQVAPGCVVKHAPGGEPDKRSYRVDFSKVQRQLPEFQPCWTARMGAEQLYEAYQRAGVTLCEELNSAGVRIASIDLGRVATPMQARAAEASSTPYDPERLPQPADVAQVMSCAVTRPWTAEMTDIHLRHMLKA